MPLILLSVIIGLILFIALYDLPLMVKESIFNIISFSKRPLYLNSINFLLFLHKGSSQIIPDSLVVCLYSFVYFSTTLLLNE
jgi:hypothetical protein